MTGGIDLQYSRLTTKFLQAHLSFFNFSFNIGYKESD